MNIKNRLKQFETLILLNDLLKQTYYKFFTTSQKVINRQFKKHLGRDVNLLNPKQFNDKLQWLKLFWDNPLAEKCADKYKVRYYVQDKIGEDYLNELLGVYESVDEINLDQLPNSFVLKATHGSGFNIICEDKSKIDWKSEFKKMRRWLRQNYYWSTREWVYKNIKPRIICEKFLKDNTNTSLTDYKIYCFNGEPMYCQVIQDRKVGSVGSIDFFDTKWNHMEFNGLQIAPHSVDKIKKPERYEEMLDLASRLANDFPFVRVDFYYVNGSIYFGELTFFPKSGFGEFRPPEWNEKIGNILKLPYE